MGQNLCPVTWQNNNLASILFFFITGCNQIKMNAWNTMIAGSRRKKR